MTTIQVVCLMAVDTEGNNKTKRPICKDEPKNTASVVPPPNCKGEACLAHTFGSGTTEAVFLNKNLQKKTVQNDDISCKDEAYTTHTFGKDVPKNTAAVVPLPNCKNEACR